MRITNNMLSQSLLRNLESAQGRMDQMQNQLSSGHRISRPSDDPAGIQNAMRLKSNISSVEQWKSNADAALQFMNTTDSTMGDMTSMLQRVRELAVQGANGTLATADRGAIADEVDQISTQLKMMANTQVGSKYMFSGTATDKELILSDGSASQANGQDIKFEVGNNLSIPVSVNGQTLFGLTSTNTPTPTGMLSTLNTLSSDLRSNDSTGVSNLLGDIDTTINNVVDQRAGLGARINRMTAIQGQLDSTSTNMQDNLSSIQDVDMAKTITDFTSQQNVYKAALSVGAKIIEPSLVDFMR
ncbi:flagellar hook-associated protein FlgL [Desulfosporosinus sp. Sb-LF]|uniref:flagellar hook-associated protein FlgL n=1 Tax=Desulfosporosinus sp. Sb-LF TaxID=2560027 RepID=UPI00107F3FDA|nr:flagellar hook-associated protein FlgL [Desulfosporosinus sp. Sb-LF]TGE32590.1 flagellar hook-associated protein FlgL [Desulfosporosinus sp. Sb-LF]